jgi:hypothetical protein
MLPSSVRNAGLLAILALGAGCNQVEFLNLTGYVQDAFSNKADIVFVIDNSSSMVQEGPALARNFDAFIQAFAGDASALPDNPTLSDDVGRYVDYVQDFTANINYTIGVTTTEPSDNWGRLLGQQPVVARTDEGGADQFVENLLCYAACLDSVPSDIPLSCPNGPPGGLRNCADSESGAAEEGIEAVFMAMCRAAESPPDACFDSWWRNTDPNDTSRVWLPSAPGTSPDDTGAPVGPTPPPAPYFVAADVGTNAGWLREDSTVVAVVVSDEGDQSRRITTRDGKVFPYDQLFREFPNRVVWSVIGPVADGGCNTGGAARWGIDRYRNLVTASNGAYIPIAESDGRGGCTDADFGAALTEIGTLLRSLTDTFPLKAVPRPGSIVVTVDGRPIDEADASVDDSLGQVVYGDGWSYRPEDNTVILHGNAVPDFNADVRVYYLPESGQPRDLPF